MHRAPLLLLLLVSSAIAANPRAGRGWFDRVADTVTKVQTMREIVTDVLPSSCVVVQTSLPSCRHLRALEEIRPARPGRIMQTDAPLPRQYQGWKPIIQPSSPVRQVNNPRAKATPPVSRMPQRNTTTPEPTSFWSNWNPFAAKIETVTSTVVETVTTQYYDPNTVVTFSVKGCRPSRLPFDLPECHEETYREPELEKILPPAPEMPEMQLNPGLIVMAPIQLVPNMHPVDVKETAKKDAAKEDKKEPAKVEPEKPKVSMVVGMEEEDKGKVQMMEKEPKNE